MDRAAVIYVINGRLVVGGNAKTTTGLRLNVDPITLPGDASAPEIGAVVLGRLEQSEVVLPHPAQTEWKGFFDPFLRAGGVRSFKAFMAGAQLIEVDQDGTGFTLTPTRNLGPKDGFEPLAQEALKLTGGASEIGATVRALIR